MPDRGTPLSRKSRRDGKTFSKEKWLLTTENLKKKRGGGSGSKIVRGFYV